jgi:hypothetical protein
MIGRSGAAAGLRVGCGRAESLTVATREPDNRTATVSPEQTHAGFGRTTGPLRQTCAIRNNAPTENWNRIR